MNEFSLLQKLIFLDQWLTDQLGTIDLALQMMRVNHDRRMELELTMARRYMQGRQATVHIQLQHLREAQEAERFMKPEVS